MGGLYGWQLRALQAWMARGHGVIVAPTGAGKTRVAVEAIRRVDVRPVLFVVPTNVLVRQHSRTLAGEGFRVGVWNGEEKRLGADVTVTTYSSAYLYADYLCRVHGMIVFDEVHHAFAEKWISILDRFLAMGGRMWMGLTATPEGVPDSMIAYVCGYDEALREGAVSGIDVHVVTLDIPASKRLEYAYITGIIERLKKLLARAEDEEEREEILRRLAIWNNRLRMLLDYSVEKEMVVADIIAREKIDRAIIFVEGIRHAETLARGLRARGLRAMPYHSGMNRVDRARVWDAWRLSGGILVAVKALDEGIDVPSCKHIFILSCPKRFRRAVQRIGRGLRPGEKLQLWIIGTIGGETLSAEKTAKQIQKQAEK